VNILKDIRTDDRDIAVASFLTLIGLAVAIFTSTNIDALFVLLGFFADKQFRRQGTL
jgi:cadmium resistance protein CadD (predicted permease)